MPSDPIQEASTLLDAGAHAASLAALEAADPAQASVWLMRARALRRLGRRAEAGDAARKALTLVRRPHEEVSALAELAATDRVEGRSTRARRRLREALGRPGADDHPGPLAQLYVELARIERQLGRAEEVEAAVRRAELHARRAGDGALRGMAWLQRARARLDRGRLDEARVTLSATASLFRQLEAPGPLAWTLLLQADYLVARGSLDAADQRLDEADALFRRHDDPLGRAAVATGRARLQAARGEPDDALATLDRAEQHLAGTDEPRAPLGLLRGRLLVALGDPSATTVLTRALVDAEQAELRLLLGPLHAALLESHARGAEPQPTAHHLRAARELLDETGITDTAAAAAARTAAAAIGRDVQGLALAPAVRAQGLALACATRLGDDQRAVDDARCLRELAERGAPIPCGDWDLTEVLGYGAMGEVWRARHHDHGTEAAVKLMLRGEAGNRRLAALVTGEIRAVAALHHPHIVQVLDHGALSPTAEVLTGGRQRAGTPWFAITLASGGTLEARCGQMAWPDVARVLLALLDALAHAHARGVVHLDLKAANVLLDAEGQHVLLTDFGIAGALAASSGSPGLLGTPHTMAPEQFRRERHRFGPWTDLYALGCLGYHLLQGRPPYPGRTLEAQRDAHLDAPVPPLRAVVRVPEGLERWLHTLMAKDPADRFPCAADAAHALAALGEPSVEPSQDTGPSARPRASLSTLSLAHLTPHATPGPSVRLPSGTPVPTSWRLPAAPLVTPRAGASLDLFRVRRPPMVGHEAACGQAWSALLDVAVDTSPAFVAVGGPPGVGTSRLLAWLGEIAHERGAAEVVRLDGGTDTLPALARQLLARPTAPDIPERDRRDVLGQANATADLEPGAIAPRAGALATLLAERARQRPQLLLLDDRPLQRPGTQDLLEAIALQDAPILVAVEADSLADLPKTARSVRIVLQHLDDPDIAALLQDLLPLQPELSRQIVTRAAGNPQLAVELLTDLVDRRLLVWHRDAFRLRDGVEVELPEHSRELWAQRLDRALVGVPARERIGVVAGALFGRHVDDAGWRAACAALRVDDPDALLHRLHRAWLVEVAADGWRFLHPALIAAAEAVPVEAGPTDAPRAVAHALAMTRGDAAAARVGELRLRAGEHAAAVPSLATGLDRARRAGDAEAVAQLADRLADALHHLGAPPDDPRWVPERLARADLALWEGDAVRAADRAAAVARLGAQGESLADAELLRARALELLGDPDAARDAYGRALRHTGEGRSLGRALLGLGGLLHHQGELDAAALHLQMAHDALADFPADRAELDLAQAHLALDHDDLPTAEAHLHAAMRRARTLALRRLEAEVHVRLGDLARRRGDADEARRRYLRGRDRCADHEVERIAGVEGRLGLLALHAGDDAVARRHLERMERLAPDLPLVAQLRLPLVAAGLVGPFEDALAAVRAQRDRGPLEPEALQALEAAAERATAPDRRRLLWALAADGWRQLDRPRAAKQAERALSRLASEPEPPESP